MNTNESHSRQGHLFLMELILCLLFFALGCSICVRVFYQAYENRQEARRLNHTQELMTLFGETFSSWIGSVPDYEASLRQAGLSPEPGASAEELLLSFDTRWNPCPSEEARWQAALIPSKGEGSKELSVRFFSLGRSSESETKTLLYETVVRYPWWEEPA